VHLETGHELAEDAPVAALVVAAEGRVRQRQSDARFLVDALEPAQRLAHRVGEDGTLRVVVELVRADERVRVEETAPELRRQRRRVGCEGERAAGARDGERQAFVADELCPELPVAERAEAVGATKPWRQEERDRQRVRVDRDAARHHRDDDRLTRSH
jgi:hypothetical protein